MTSKMDSNVEVSRPEPAGYYRKASEGEGLLAWDRVVERMSGAGNYWVATIRPDGRPHAMPVWGVWLNESFVFSTSPQSRKARNLAANPYVVVHLESGDDVVVIEGVAEEISDAGLLQRFADAYNPKYDWDFTLEQLRKGVYEVRPRRAFSWLDSRGEGFAGTATRWRFPAS